MKHKNAGKAGMTAVLSAVLILSCGCDLFGGFSGPKYTLETPAVKVYGNVLAWDEVEGATYYLVSGSEGYSEEVKEPFCAPPQPAAGSYTVTAKNASETSQASASVNVFNMEANHGEEETIALADGEVYTIASTVNCVTVTGSAVNSCIKVYDRVAPLYIVLDSVSITAPPKLGCIAAYDGAIDKAYTVIVEVRGINSLTATDVTEIPGQPAENSEIDGGTGYSGGNGLNLPNIVLIGSGQLSCKGGNGGDGGKGADSAGWVAKAFGDGGDGGAGGSGIRCTLFFLNMSGDGIVYSVGGKGGTGGSPGANGSVITGPVLTATWNQCFGQMGVDGIAVRGAVKKISGMSEF